MKGWQFTGTNIPLELIEKEDPKAIANHVVIDVKAAGLCHSDVAALQDPGWMPLFPNGPVIMGHEFAGVVIEVGEGVEDIKVGDRVGANPMDRATKVTAGYNYDGGYAEKVRVPAHQCVKIPDGVSFVEGAASTDAGITAYRAIFSIGQAKEGTKLGIIGIGGLGQFAVQMALIKGCEVYATDVSPEARKLAEELGAKVYDTILDMKEAECDVIVDFAGFGQTTADALEAVKLQGTVVIVGMGKLESNINTYLMITKEIKLLGSNGGTVEDLKGVYDCFATGKMNPNLITIPFEEIDKGLEKLKNHEVKGRLVAVVE
ncbi:zinc-binding dehydrogenase [Cytobacillus purgationiresistens]|uniref:Alcohol dehydrogenase n=1 Tax=Cytobacillus purgationiresistens TaxID=863449 RepID=A0ABU0AQ58_9BACI|nr:zinc-binding dehydrogenase [Cytobacillus purgationiresistens]MDQ0273355.1 propanol-preferring alcohol dehydrogenase [Cytobacillus purgationiresistens]